jgi:hypothetical protein
LTHSSAQYPVVYNGGAVLSHNHGTAGLHPYITATVCAVDGGVVLAGVVDGFWSEEQVDKTSAERPTATMDKDLMENMIESPFSFGYDHHSQITSN